MGSACGVVCGGVDCKGDDCEESVKVGRAMLLCSTAFFGIGHVRLRDTDENRLRRRVSVWVGVQSVRVFTRERTTHIKSQKWNKLRTAKKICLQKLLYKGRRFFCDN